MRSFIIIEVEHGEDTDSLDYFVGLTGLNGGGGSMNAIDHIARCGFNLSLVDYTLKVDLPPYLTAVNVNAALEVRA